MLLFTEKYTPKHFSDFGTEKKEIVHLLKHLIQINCCSMMIIGPNGSGKTLLIEVFLSEFFQGNVCAESILRINVLKEQGIHFYRNDLKYFCQNIASTQKFVIMDDLDYLNEQSQQVIRNCIQKYSHNIHFIASCTNQQKVIETFNAMLLPIKLFRIQPSLLESIYDRIVSEETIDIDSATCKQYLVETRNNVKSLINDLQKCKLYNTHITLDTIKDLLCDINHHMFDSFLELLQKDSVQLASNLLFNLHHEGFSVIDILTQFYEYIKYHPDLSDALKYEVTKVVTKFITLFHNLHEDPIELVFFSNNLSKLFSRLKNKKE
jgi:DNA polymerase III delta prime subunit